ncbi:MAG: DUF1573 domain-containing protein [Planctomycetes bacterium]|nr:DUF1573 domain-containing protein [Planctomycetota bacterium]
MYSSAVSAGGPRIEISPRQVDFGVQGHNERPEEVITVKNSGDKPLVVQKVDVSCDCLQVLPRTFGPLPPGQFATLRISMGSGRAMGRLDKKVTFITNDAAAPQVSLPVTMSVFEGFEMNPSSVQFKGIYGGKPVEVAVDLRRRYPAGAAVKLEVKDIAGRFGSSGKEFFKTAVSSIPKGQRLTITLDPRHPEGRINAELTAVLNGKKLVIPLAGEMFAWIFVDPTFISFNKVSPADPNTLVQEIRLNSTDGTAFSIVKVEQQGNRGDVSFKFATSSNPDQKVHAVQALIPPEVEVKPNESFFGKILITTDHPKKRQITISYGGFFAR